MVLRMMQRIHLEMDIRCCWKILNWVKVSCGLWSARNMLVIQHIVMSVRECCQFAHCRLQDDVLRYALKHSGRGPQSRLLPLLDIEGQRRWGHPSNTGRDNTPGSHNHGKGVFFTGECDSPEYDTIASTDTGNTLHCTVAAQFLFCIYLYSE